MEQTGAGNGRALSDPSAPLLGSLLDGRYRLDSEIARGGMATVYLATDTRLDRSVAVKVMHRALAEDPEFVARFTREAKASAKLSAAEIVAVHDYGTDDATGLAYLVMENVRGTNLRQLIAERGALTPGRAVSLIEPVLRALAAAHAAGLLHRDIKPENVLLADDGRVKVADFGLARAIETSNLTQTTGLLIGTVAYLAPEQVESGTSDARSDVYAAGVLLFEMLTGTPPYSGESPLSVAYKHVHQDIPPPSSLVAVPPALDDLVVRATRRDPDARPADGAAFLAELREVARGLPAVSAARGDQNTLIVPRPAVPPPPPRTRTSRRGLVLLSSLLVMALLALGGGYYLGSYRYTKAPGVLGLERTAATARVEAAGLTPTFKTGDYDDTVPKDRVLRQEPGPGDRVRKSGTVTLFLSQGPKLVTVPAAANKTVAAVQQALRSVGLAVNSDIHTEFSDRVAKDLVTRTDPPSGQQARPGTTVTIYKSLGHKPVTVPDVVGMQQTEATGMLRGKGFVVRITQAFSDSVPVGEVMDQAPRSGPQQYGSTVAITVSKGPDLVTVPDVRGEKVGDAKRQLEAAGFQTRVIDTPGGTNRVLNTDPEPGKKARRGSMVTIYTF